LPASVLALAILLAGCDSTQPESAPAQTAQIAFKASAVVDVYHCWEVWSDTSDPPDGTPDTFTDSYTCEQLFSSPEVPLKQQAENAPWRYSIAITVIRAGQTQEEIIAASIIPGDSIEDFVSLTPYDSNSDTGGQKPFDGQFYYLNGRRVTNANPLYFASRGLPIDTPNVLLETPTYDVNLNVGDTLIVRARKQAYADSPGWLDTSSDPSLVLSATVTLGGISLPLEGTASSPTEDKAGVTFSFTRQ